MRPTRLLIPLLVSTLFGCGSVQIVLKPPIEQQCGTAGLRGCPALTDGVLLYVQGDKVKGKEALIKGAAQNAPEKLKKFAELLKGLDKIPGTNAYMKQVLEVADIIASAPGKPPRKKRGRGAPAVVDIETRYASGPIEGDEDGATIVPGINSDRGSCGNLQGYAYCVWAATGPLVVTELEANPSCRVELVAGAAKTAQAIDSPRWIAKNPHGPTRVFVRDGESLFIGVQSPNSDPFCGISWSGVYPDQ
jgi:hypothetical protein